MEKKEKYRLSAKIVDAVFERRRKRQMPVCSLQKLERLRALYPEMRPEASARALAIKKCAIALACMTAAIIISILLLFTNQKRRLNEDFTIDRPSNDQRAEEVSVRLQSQDKDYDIKIDVEPSLYTAEEVEGLFSEAEKEYMSMLKGRNETLDDIRYDLNLATDCSIRGMKAEWDIGPSDCIRRDGTVDRTRIQEMETVSITLTMILTERGEERGRRTAGTKVEVLPIEVQPEDEFRQVLESAIAKAGEEGDSKLVLPTVIGDRAVTYSEPSDIGDAVIVVVLGVVAAAALAYLQDKRLIEAAGKRDRQMLLDYGEFVGELTVLTGAGLSVRQAWKRIVSNMQAEQEKGAERRYLYREMLLTKNAIDRGVPEEYAYKDFGRRCGQPPYLRLGSLLETNIRKGSKGLNDMLRQEADDAFGDRMQLARREGEKISSKLLIPMMLQFMLVLIILMVPAFMSF
ncbi:MAG: hypothetical protein J6Y90_00570 [Lachnospiraceae bacterium]|nr:hypothetical protein [Lachnospiraceae bacterium]